jgi:hypothetical protein
VAALEAAGQDDTPVSGEDSKLKEVAAGRCTAAARIAIGALGGAGGSLLSG